MKKILGIILLVALTFVTFGCKPHVEQNFDKVKPWKDAQVITGTDFVNVLRITADNEAIDWWIVTDEDGVLYEEGVDYVFVDETGKTYSEEALATLETEKIAKGESLSIKFNDKKAAVVLIIYQPEVAPSDIPDGADKDSLKGSEDFRGKFTNLHNSGYEAKASKYGESVDPYGIIELWCNEKAGDAGVNWHGDYRITEVWPLVQEGAEWKAKDGLKWIFEGDKVVEYGETVKLAYPAGNSVFAIKQPDRFDMSNAGDAEAYEKQKDYYWCFSFSDSIEVFNIKQDKNETLSNKPIEAHKLNPKVSSSACQFYFTLGSLYKSKSALGTEYIVDEFYASDEK